LERVYGDNVGKWWRLKIVQMLGHQIGSFIDGSRNWSWGAKSSSVRAESRRRRHQGGWSVGRGCFLPTNFFYILRTKRHIFVDFVLSFFFYDHNNIELQQECKDCDGDWLACDKKCYSRASIVLLGPWSNPPKLCKRWCGGKWGESISPQPTRDWGSVMSSPSGVWGEASAKNEFGAF